MIGARRATAVAWLSITVLSLAAAVLTVLAWGDLKTQDAVSNLASAPAAVLYATLGALVVRRAGNIIGWMLLGIPALSRPRSWWACWLSGPSSRSSLGLASCCCCSHPGACRRPGGARSRDWACWPPR